MTELIPIEDIPSTGQIQLIVFFKEYKRSSVKTNIQNESREFLRDNIPLVGTRVGIELTPMLFGILRHVEDLKTRSIGVTYSFTYTKMTPTIYRDFLTEVKKRFESELERPMKIWREYDILVASEVGGL